MTKEAELATSSRGESRYSSAVVQSYNSSGRSDTYRRDGDGRSTGSRDGRRDSEGRYERESSYRDRGYDRDRRKYTPRGTPSRTPEGEYTFGSAAASPAYTPPSRAALRLLSPWDGSHGWSSSPWDSVSPSPLPIRAGGSFREPSPAQDSTKQHQLRLKP